MDGDSPASPPSGGISRSRKPASIVTPADKEPALDLSDSGRFQCGLVSISNKGLIVSDPASASEPDGSLESGKVPSTVTFELGPEDFDPLEIVGHGASSYVRKALHKKSQTVMALKVIRVFEVEKVKALMTEISTLYNAECPQLVTFHGAFSHEGAVSIALEFATAGSLTDLVRLSGGMTEQTVALIVEQILLGLRFMHKDRHLVHRDFKPSNLLVDHSGRVFLTDFGVAGNLKSSGDLCATFVGTYLYMSPERFSGEQYSYSADVWSLGIVILECLTATFPWACSRGYWDLMNHIIHDPAPTVPEDPRFSDDLRSFVSRCLVKDPEQRASVVELLEHPFITSRLAHLSAVEKSTALSEWVSSLRSVFVCSMPRESIDPSQVAREFILLFHSLFAGRRHTLSSLYRPESTLTLSLRGAEVTATGREEIMGQLLRLDIHQTLDESADWKTKAALISAAGEPLMFRVEATGTVGHEAVDRFSEEMVLVEFPGSDSFWVQSHRLTVTTGPAVQ